MHPGDFLDEVAYLLVVLDPEANDIFEVLRDEDLAIFPRLADDQVKGNVLLATRTPAIGLSAGTFPDGKGSPDETAVMDELTDFVEAIRQKRKPKVEGEHGLQALLLANLIKQATEKNLAGKKASGTL